VPDPVNKLDDDTQWYIRLTEITYQKRCVTRSVVMVEDETVCIFLRSFSMQSFLKRSNKPL